LKTVVLPGKALKDIPAVVKFVGLHTIKKADPHDALKVSPCWRLCVLCVPMIGCCAWWKTREPLTGKEAVCQLLSRLLFNRHGSNPREIKQNILDFNGLVFPDEKSEVAAHVRRCPESVNANPALTTEAQPTRCDSACVLHLERGSVCAHAPVATVAL